MFARSSAPYVCKRCLAHQRKASLEASIVTRPITTTATPSSIAVELTNRRVISVSGTRAGQFLQGLTTNNLREGPGQGGLYSSFLTAQGRVLNDVFIFKDVPVDNSKKSTYFIDVEADQADKLYTHLDRHNLGSGIKLRRVVDLIPWSVRGAHSGRDGAGNKSPLGWTPHSHPDIGSPDENSDLIEYSDGRAPGMGKRLLLSKDERPEGTEAEESLEDYTVRRILRGVPEGQSEILREQALLQESNIDFMGGVDFRKGCYVGQELTIRTHHTGVVRKRILPVQLYLVDSSPPERLSYSASTLHLPPTGTNIFRQGDEKKRSTGKFLRGIGNIGFALCRLEAMTDLPLPGPSSGRREAYAAHHRFQTDWSADEGRPEGSLGVRAFVPDWWPRNVKPDPTPS